MGVPRAAGGLAVLAAAVLAACTGTPEPPETISSRGDPVPSPAVSRAPVPTRTAGAAWPHLTCKDGTTAISGGPAERSQWRLGLWAENWRGDATQPAPGAVMFWKGFLYVSPTAAASTTIRVESPTNARLYYVPYAWWGQPAGGVPSLGLYNLPKGRREIAFGACPKALVGYTGGIQTVGAACVTLVVQAGRRSERLTIPLGTRC